MRNTESKGEGGRSSQTVISAGHRRIKGTTLIRRKGVIEPPSSPNLEKARKDRNVPYRTLSYRVKDQDESEINRRPGSPQTVF